MLILLSPAKTLDFSPREVLEYSRPSFIREASELNGVLKKKSVAELMDLMSISEKLAIENHKRNKQYKKEHTPHNSKQAIFGFKGDVYLGLDAQTLSKQEIAYAQKHLRILSGLYGVLKPLDLMQAYRLEMGTTLHTSKGNNLYQFWKDKIAKLLTLEASQLGGGPIVNLASDEYFSVVNNKALKVPVLNINFKERRDGVLRFVTFNAKKARGIMARSIIKDGLSSIETANTYDINGYLYSEEHSTGDSWLFIKEV